MQCLLMLAETVHHYISSDLVYKYIVETDGKNRNENEEIEVTFDVVLYCTELNAFSIVCVATICLPCSAHTDTQSVYL